MRVVLVVLISALFCVSFASAAAAAQPRWLVVGERVTVRGSTALVPVRCDDLTCLGTIRSGDGPAARFRLNRAEIAGFVRVRVSPRARRARFVVTLGGSPTYAVRRRLLHHARARAGCAPPWADVVASDGAAKLWRTTRRPDVPVHACVGSRLSRTVPAVLADGTEAWTGVGAVNGSWAALELIGPAHIAQEGPYGVARLDLRSGAVTHLPLAPAQASTEDYAVLAAVVGSRGTVVVVDRLRGSVRVRELSDGVDRLLDERPGIDPDSLVLRDHQLRWVRDGMTEHARID
jgi:hypothetical protein